MVVNGTNLSIEFSELCMGVSQNLLAPPSTGASLSVRMDGATHCAMSTAIAMIQPQQQEGLRAATFKPDDEYCSRLSTGRMNRGAFQLASPGILQPMRHCGMLAPICAGNMNASTG
jgi:hypothetical protein